MNVKFTRLLLGLFLLLAGLLTACSNTGSQGTKLEGTSWQVTEINGQKVPTKLGVTVNFEADGKVGGKAPCNSYFADYDQRGEQLTFSMIGSTEMACLDEGVMELETDFFQCLGQVHSFKLESETLILQGEGGESLMIAIK
jgi:heat shock protein HslJ